MNTFDFFGLLINNIGLYLSVLLVVIIIYYSIFRRICNSVLDPLFIAILASIFGTSVVFFLYFTGHINHPYFLSYFFTQFAFIAGVFVIKPRRKTVVCEKRYLSDNRLYIKSLFSFSFFFFVVSNLIVYAKLGIPILFESRLDLTMNAGGWGIFTRFAAISGTVAFYLFLYYTIIHKSRGLFRFMLYFYFTFHLLTLVLSGAKSSFWSLAVVFFCFLIVNRNNDNVSHMLLKSRKIEWKLITVGLVFSLITILITFSNDIHEALTFLVQRFVGYGDIYWHAYPNGYIEDLPDQSPVIAVFASFLGFFRMIDPSQMPEPIGYALTKMFYSVDFMVGPNPRHNIFGYVYLGAYLSVIYSFVLGVILSVIRASFFKSYNGSIIYKIIIINVYIFAAGLETDINYFFFQLNNLLIVLPIILIGAYFIYLFICVIKFPDLVERFTRYNFRSNAI